MSRCRFKDEKGERGGVFKRHNIETDPQEPLFGKCKRCKRPRFVKVRKEENNDSVLPPTTEN